MVEPPPTDLEPPPVTESQPVPYEPPPVTEQSDSNMNLKDKLSDQDKSANKMNGGRFTFKFKN